MFFLSVVGLVAHDDFLGVLDVDGGHEVADGGHESVGSVLDLFADVFDLALDLVELGFEFLDGVGVFFELLDALVLIVALVVVVVDLVLEGGRVCLGALEDLLGGDVLDERLLVSEVVFERTAPLVRDCVRRGYFRSRSWTWRARRPCRGR